MTKNERTSEEKQLWINYINFIYKVSFQTMIIQSLKLELSIFGKEYSMKGRIELSRELMNTTKNLYNNRKTLNETRSKLLEYNPNFVYN